MQITLSNAKQSERHDCLNTEMPPPVVFVGQRPFDIFSAEFRSIVRPAGLARKLSQAKVRLLSSCMCSSD